MAKLSQRQWDNIEKRLLSGESSFAISKDYPVSRQAIDKHFGCIVRDIKETANQIVKAEESLRKLPEVAQVTACNLASDLMAISMHVANGAKLGAMTFSRLSSIAHKHAEQLDENDPDPEQVLNVARLTKTGNEAVATALNLLNANKAAIEKAANEQEAAKDIIHKIELVALTNDPAS